MRRAAAHVATALLLAACGGGSGDPTIDADPATPDGPPGGPDGPVTGACGGTAPTGRFDRTIDVGGTARTYILDVPAGYDGTGHPLIFAWHGRTGSASSARSYFGIDDVAGSEALIVYPQGLPVSADPADTGWELGAAGRDVALFDAVLAEIQGEYCVGRIYSMGHSFGGYMSNSLACYRGGAGASDVRAIAPIAGGGPFGTCTGDPVSAVVIHGMLDMVVPFTEGEAARDHWLEAAGCTTTSDPIDPSPCVAYTGCTAGLAVRFCVHTDTTSSGHGWPGFASGAAWDLFQASP